MEVDVRDAAADRIVLVLLQHGVMRRRLPLEDDVQDRMQPAGTRERAAEIPLGDADRVRGLALAVEDTWDQALPAQAP